MLAFQALVIALCAWFAATACPMWLRWSVYFGAPLVAGLVNGLLLGDVAYGLSVGSTVMMAYIGMVAIGGSLPSDYALAGYLGVAMTMLAGADPSVGLTIAVPIGLLGLLSFNVKMSLNSIWVHKADQYATEGNARGVVRMNLFASQIFPFITYAIPSFLCVYFGSGALETVLSVIPEQVTSILSLAGHLIPALGLAMLTSVLAKASLIPFFLIGFALSAYLGLGTMPIAIIGVAVGILHLIYTSKDGASVLENLSLGKGDVAEIADEAAGVKHLSKKTLRRSWFAWQSWGQICYNYERMMGLGFCHCMVPVLEELYGDDQEAIAQGLKRHLAYFNTENTWGSIIPGITAAMEEERANGASIDDDMENNLKTALMGPMAGIGDSVTQSLVKVVLLSIAIGLSSAGSALGPILLILLFSAYALGVGYFCFFSGYKFGKTAVTKLLAGGLVKQLTEGLGAMGMMVIGCLVATVIPITSPLSFELATGTMQIQSILDTILPKLLPLIAFLLTYRFIKKGTKPTTVIIAMFIVAIVLSPLGVLS
jgi:PTS system mannose-specific IID component